MDCTVLHLPYRQTGYFSKIITDYLDEHPSLAPFYQYPVNLEGARSAIARREKHAVDRSLLVNELKKQYEGLSSSQAVSQNLERLLLPNTFTVTTAHQPAIFTGPLYFIYKILHAIRLAAMLAEQFGDKNFVPVYYMGSEDADLDELGHIFIGEEKIIWETKQTGAVGRMKTSGLDKIIARIEGEFSVQPFGKVLVQLLKDAYLSAPDIQTATLRLVHALFAGYGLLVLIPDNTAFKKKLVPVFEEELFQQASYALVAETISRLEPHYKVQANPRAINLFYLKDGLRNRIEKVQDLFVVHETSIRFSETEMRNELQEHPERFSPNVMLRGLMQEIILPNVAFIGGGGELAYWLELKSLFAHYRSSYPLLVLRNSFLVVEKKWKEKMEKLGLETREIFQSPDDILNGLIKKASPANTGIGKEIALVNECYDAVRSIAQKVDTTLGEHTEALRASALKSLKELEKKMLRAEKRKFQTEQKQVHDLKSTLFPLNNLQERIENFIPYYARWGEEFIQALYKHSPALSQEFVVLEEN